MRVYVINLDRAPERMAHMHAQLEKLGIPYTRISAIDARLLGNDAIDEFRRSVAMAVRPHYWEPARIGVFMSHKKVWRKIASGSDSVAAVFEDDVHLSEKAAVLLTDEKWIRPSMDIVRLETTEQSMRLARQPAAQKDQMKLFRVESSAWGAAGYIVRQDIAKWLDCSPPHTYEPVDYFLFHPESALRRGLRIFQLDPAPCVQDQYHPSPIHRLNFAMETKQSSGIADSLIKRFRRLASPIVRKLMGRRAVRFR